MKTTKRIWNKTELTIAYYIAKWDYNGLAIEEEDLVEAVIENTTVASLRFQVANFRHVLNIEGFKKEGASAEMFALAEELKDTTSTNVRKIVLKAIENSEAKIKSNQVNKENKAAMKKRDLLNALSQKNFEAEMKLRKNLGQRLTPLSNRNSQ